MLNVRLTSPSGLPISMLRKREVALANELLMKVNNANTPPTTEKSPKSETPRMLSTNRDVYRPITITVIRRKYIYIVFFAIRLLSMCMAILFFVFAVVVIVAVAAVFVSVAIAVASSCLDAVEDDGHVLVLAVSYVVFKVIDALAHE